MGDNDDIGHSPTGHLALGETEGAVDSDTLAAARKTPSEEMAPGTRLGDRYELIRLLGEGGMGAVHLAHDHVLGTQVALKFVHTRSTNRLDSLRDEVLLAQKVTHRNVCRTYDLEEVGGRHLVKMEFVAGETLAQRVSREKRLPVAETLATARSILQGLQAAHAVGVVHRDLKPRNVLIEEGTGRVVLMDFGLARTTASTGNTESDGISGTPEYMAPEQVRAGKVDGRTDLYALGCLLYELLAGKIPFPADTPMARALRQVEDPPPDVRLENPEVPSWLAQLILDLMQKDRDARPASTEVVLARLDGPQPRSRKRFIGVALLVGALAIGSGVVVLWPAKEWRPQVRELRHEYEENIGYPALSPDGKQLAFISDRLDRENPRWNLFIEDLDTQKARQVPTAMQVVDLRWTRDGRSLLFVSVSTNQAFRMSLEDQKSELIAEDVTSLDDCGGGRIVVGHYGSPGHLITLLSPGSAERQVVPPQPNARIDDVRCDPAGQNVSYWVDRHPPTTTIDAPFEIWVAPLDGGAPREVASGMGNLNPTFSADGRSIIYSAVRDERRNLFESALAGGAPHRLTVDEGPDHSPIPSGDGKWLLYDLDTTHPTVFVRSAGGRPRRITSRSDNLRFPALSVDGRALLTQQTQHRGRSGIAWYPVDGAAPRRLAENGIMPHPTRDGREVLFVRPLEGRGQIVAVSIEGGRERVLGEIEGVVGWVGHLWDGMVHVIVFQRSQTPSVWKLPLSGGPAVLTRVGSFYSILELADGWRLATNDKEMRIVRPGKALDSAPALILHPTRFGWTPNGRTVWYVEDGQLHRFVLATEKDTLLSKEPPEHLTVADDGETLYYAAATGTARRMMITNFAERLK